MTAYRFIALALGSMLLSILIGVGFGVAMHDKEAAGSLGTMAYFGLLAFGFAISPKGGDQR